jgi:hypothetical protein
MPGPISITDERRRLVDCRMSSILSTSVVRCETLKEFKCMSTSDERRIDPELRSTS